MIPFKLIFVYGMSSGSNLIFSDSYPILLTSFTEMILYIYTHMYVYDYMYMYVCTSILFQILFHYRMLQNIEYRSLGYIVSLCWLSILCMLLLLLLSRFSRIRLCATPEMAAHQAPPSLGFTRQEHWSGLPFPSPMHESEKWKWTRSVSRVQLCATP